MHPIKNAFFSYDKGMSFKNDLLIKISWPSSKVPIYSFPLPNTPVYVWCSKYLYIFAKGKSFILFFTNTKASAKAEISNNVNIVLIYT